jgi:hypothetical protein
MGPRTPHGFPGAYISIDIIHREPFIDFHHVIYRKIFRKSSRKETDYSQGINIMARIILKISGGVLDLRF